MRRAEVIAALLPLLPVVSAQIVITIAVPTCSTSSVPFPFYSSDAASYGSMESPSTGSQATWSSTGQESSIPAASGPSATTAISSSQQPLPSTSLQIGSTSSSRSYSSITPTTSNSTPSPSASVYTDTEYGYSYTVYADSGLTGIAIAPITYGRKGRRQFVAGMDGTLEDCASSCSRTSNCVALAVMGTTCQLFSSVSGTMYLVGGEVAFNEARFEEFSNATVTYSMTFRASTSTVSLPTTISSGSLVIMPGSLGGISSSTPSLSSTTALGLSDSISESTATTRTQDAFTITASGTPSWWTQPPNTSESFFTPAISSVAASSSAPGDSTASTVGWTSTTAPSLVGTLVSGLSESSSLPSPPTSTSISVSADETSASTLSASSQSIATSLPTRNSGSAIADPSLRPSSSSMIASATPSSQSGIACPRSNGTTVTDVNGVRYFLVCSSDMGGNVFGSAQASRSFEDCFNYCDSAATCTGFTYSGAANGAGSGNCYLKNGAVYFTASDELHIAAIRVSPFVVSSSSVDPSASLSTTAGVIISTATMGLTAGATSSSSSMTTSISASSSALSSSTPLASSSTTPTLSSVALVSSSTSLQAATTTSITTTTTTTTTSSSGTSSTSSAVLAGSCSQPPLTAPSPYLRNNGKRGLAYTNGSFTLPYTQIGQNSQVSWGYNWYNERWTDGNCITNPAMRFIPILWSDAPDLITEWPARAQIALDAGADALMSFNEPDLCAANSGAACMPLDRSVVAYQNYMMPFQSKTRLGAPAVSNGGEGLVWLQHFMGNCTECHFDFINIHWYANAFATQYFFDYVQQAYAMFQKPIWITEFGMSGNEYETSDAQTQIFLQTVLPWLDAVPYVERYAWFLDSPGYLLNADGSGLSAQGVIYNSYTANCPDWTRGNCSQPT